MHSDELGLVVSACSSEFGLPPSGSDPPFFHHDHKLGIAFWAIPSIIDRAVNLFRSVQSGSELVDATRVILLINADHYSAWNRRRSMILNQCLEPDRDLKLLNLIFSKHPKSGEAWAYRRWLLSLPSTVFSESLVRSEMSICDRISDIYPRNYYAWSHRRWICDQFPVNLGQRLTESQAWISMHVSDYSALHYRLTLVRDQLRTAEADLDREFEFAHDLCNRYPGHESIWYYLKSLWILISAANLPYRERLLSERNFVQYCIDFDDAANYHMQRAHAASYLFHILIRYPVWDQCFIPELVQLSQQLQSWAPHHIRLWRKLHDIAANMDKPLALRTTSPSSPLS